MLAAGVAAACAPHRRRDAGALARRSPTRASWSAASPPCGSASADRRSPSPRSAPRSSPGACCWPGGAVCARFPLWPLLGAAITLAIFAAPYRWDKPGVLGWNVGNDSVIHATYADALGMPDRAPIAGSSAYGVVQTFAGGYPEGSHALLAAVLAFSRDPLTTFNPVLAVLMAFAAFPAYWLIRRQLASAPLAGIGAAGAAAGYLQFGFYSQGFMPQLARHGAALRRAGPRLRGDRGRLARPRRDGGRHGCGGGDRLLGRGRRVPRPGRGARARSRSPSCPASPSACASLLPLPLRSQPALSPSCPSCGARSISCRAAAGAAGDPAAFISDRGNLPGPVDKLTALGAWIGPDYRVPYSTSARRTSPWWRPSFLAAVAVLVALWRRRLALPALLVAVGAGAVYVAVELGHLLHGQDLPGRGIPDRVRSRRRRGRAHALPLRPRLAHARRRWRAPLASAASPPPWSSASGMAAHGSRRHARRVPPASGARSRDAPHGLGLALIHDDWAKALLPDAAVPYDGELRRATSDRATASPGCSTSIRSTPASLGIVLDRRAARSAARRRRPRRSACGASTAAYRLWAALAGPRPATTGTLPLEPANARRPSRSRRGVARRARDRPARGPRGRRHAHLSRCSGTSRARPGGRGSRDRAFVVPSPARRAARAFGVRARRRRPLPRLR